MEKIEKLTFDEWCISLVGEMGNSKEDLAIKEELKNLVHDEPGENVPRGTKDSFPIDQLAKRRSILEGTCNRKHKCLSNIVPDVIKGTCINIGPLGVGETYFIETIIDKNKISYAEYVKNVIEKMYDVNKDGERAGDKVVEGYQGKTRGVGLSGKEDKKGFTGRLGAGHVENLTSAGGPEKDNLAVWEEWVNRLKGVKCSVIDDANKDTIVEGFELEMMFDALNSVVFNKKDQISEKNINKIIKTLFRKFDITLKD